MRWTDSSRRQFCRGAFLLLCLVPTGFVLWASQNVRSVRQWELFLAAELKLDVSIRAVANPYPGVTRFEEMEISSKGRVIGRCPRATFHYLSAAELQLDELQLETEGLRQLCQFLERHGTRLSGLKIRGGNLCLLPPAGNLPLESVNFAHWNLISVPAPNQFWNVWRLNKSIVSGRPDDLELVIRHSEGGESGHDLQMTLDARECVPAWMLAACGADWFRHLAAARFTGTLAMSHTESGSFGSLSHCLLDGIQLPAQRLDAEPRLAGQFMARIRQLVWRDNKLHQADCDLQAIAGQVDSELLKSLVRHFPFEPPRLPLESAGIEFGRLAARITLSGGTCRLAPLGNSTTALCWTADDQPLLGIDPARPATLDLEQLVRVYLEPANPALLADDQLVDWLYHFHLPPDSRSARTQNGLETELR